MSEARALASETPAPWAEIVPRRGRTTVEEMLRLPDDGWRYEVVEGVLVRMAGSGDEATTIGQTMSFALNAHIRPRRLGIVTGADGVYKFKGAETGLLPDVGFYAAEKRARIVDRTKPIPFAPDLAVEVASPSQDRDALAAKARRYLRGGTRLVWVVWPDRREIDVWRTGDHTYPSAVLTDHDRLDGNDVVPDFVYPVADVFADPLD